MGKPDNSIEKLLRDKERVYGKYINNATLSQRLLKVIQTSTHYNTSSDVIKEGIYTILQKIARICNGSSSHLDNYDDIAGYALLIKKDCEKKEIKV